ncbi:hypothetical protein L6R49_04070, partial [Myxococcota bacterium]|nr:hypothetical protein [Myxococcota bacterium]
MASCTLKLRLLGDAESFAPGETIRGEVVVTTSSAVRCEGLRVRLIWRTSGKGNVDEGVCAEDPLEANAAWEAGERVYPFSLHVPEGPPAYEGELLQVSHLVVASADIPWAFDPKDERAVSLPGDGRWRSAAGNRPMVAGSQGSSVEIARKVLLGVLICVFVPFGLLFLPLVLAVMFPPTRNWLARQRLGEVSAGMDLQRGSPGQPLSVWVRAPRAGSLIRVVEATLRCDEVAIAGTGKHKTTHSRIPHQVVTTLARETDGTYHGALVIPPTTAWSFESNFNRVEWSLVVQGRVAGWVDWIVRFPISVDPPSALAAAPPRLAAAPVVEPIAPAPIVEPIA